MTFTITVYCHHDTWTVTLMQGVEEDEGQLITHWAGSHLPTLLTRASLRLQNEETAARQGLSPTELAAMRAKIRAAFDQRDAGE